MQKKDKFPVVLWQGYQIVFMKSPLRTDDLELFYKQSIEQFLITVGIIEKPISQKAFTYSIGNDSFDDIGLNIELWSVSGR